MIVVLMNVSAEFHFVECITADFHFSICCSTKCYLNECFFAKYNSD
jgi:hypothetical protein